MDSLLLIYLLLLLLLLFCVLFHHCFVFIFFHSLKLIEVLGFLLLPCFDGPDLVLPQVLLALPLLVCFLLFG